jgi:hypothetical protein
VEAWVVEVVQLAGVATLAVVGVVAGAEERLQLGQLVLRHGNFLQLLVPDVPKVHKIFFWLLCPLLTQTVFFVFIFLLSMHYCPTVMSINNANSNIFIFLQTLPLF